MTSMSRGTIKERSQWNANSFLTWNLRVSGYANKVGWEVITSANRYAPT